MPIYEYECEKCGAHLEVIQRMGDKALTRCSKCRGKVRKVVSRSSFQLKGGGWYVTDYARKGTSESEARTESKASTESKATTESKSKTESKPATTSTS